MRCADHFLRYFWAVLYDILDRFYDITGLLNNKFKKMKDLEKKESQESVQARLKREYEKLQADYLKTCAINEMWRRKVKEMEERKNELLKRRAERENEKE